MSQIYADNWCLNEKSSSRETFYIYFKYFFLIIRINELLLPSLYTPLSSAVCKVCSRAGVIRCSDVIFRLSPFIDKPSISEAMLNSPRRKEVGCSGQKFDFYGFDNLNHQERFVMDENH